MDKLYTACARVRQPGHAAAILGISDHPAIQDCIASHGRLRARVLGLVVYHCDLQTQYNMYAASTQEVKEQRKASAKAYAQKKAEEEKKEMSDGDVHQPSNVGGGLVLKAAGKHLKTVLRPKGKMYSCSKHVAETIGARFNLPLKRTTSRVTSDDAELRAKEGDELSGGLEFEPSTVAPGAAQ